jgi:hypothetical protein
MRQVASVRRVANTYAVRRGDRSPALDEFRNWLRHRAGADYFAQLRRVTTDDSIPAGTLQPAPTDARGAEGIL